MVSNTTVWSVPRRDPLGRPASLGGHRSSCISVVCFVWLKLPHVCSLPHELILSLSHATSLHVFWWLSLSLACTRAPPTVVNFALRTVFLVRLSSSAFTLLQLSCWTWLCASWSAGTPRLRYVCTDRTVYTSGGAFSLSRASSTSGTVSSAAVHDCSSWILSSHLASDSLVDWRSDLSASLHFVWLTSLIRAHRTDCCHAWELETVSCAALLRNSLWSSFSFRAACVFAASDSAQLRFGFDYRVILSILNLSDHGNVTLHDLKDFNQFFDERLLHLLNHGKILPLCCACARHLPLPVHGNVVNCVDRLRLMHLHTVLVERFGLLELSIVTSLAHRSLFVDILLLKNLDVLVEPIDLCLSDRCRIQASYSALCWRSGLGTTLVASANLSDVPALDRVLPCLLTWLIFWLLHLHWFTRLAGRACWQLVHQSVGSCLETILASCAFVTCCGRLRIFDGLLHHSVCVTWHVDDLYNDSFWNSLPWNAVTTSTILSAIWRTGTSTICS